MSNEFYDHINAPPTGSQLSSAIMRAEFSKIEQGFGKLPVMATGANKLVQVNSSGTALQATDSPDINGGTIDGANIGATVAGTGAFTTLSASVSASVPTVAVDTNTTDAASTAFVLGQGALTTPNMDGAAAAGTSSKFSKSDHVHPQDTSRAPANNAILTGTTSAETLNVTVVATVPTLAVDSNTTGAASTAFVLGQGSSSTPAMNGSAAAGSSTRFSKGDHVHPVDTSRAPVANPIFTGTVTLAQDPVSGLQAATKQYVDAVSVGIDSHTACVCATTANISLSGLAAIDGYTPTAGDRILVKNQSTLSQNGIYVAAAGAWSRATDADATGEIKPGTYVFVNNGATQANTGWTQQTTGTITIGSTAIVWSQFSSAQSYSAGTALSLIGSTFNVTTIPVANGGTGAVTAGAAPFALKGSNADITSLAGLTTALSVAQGGTGATTLTGIVKGTGTSALTPATGTDVTSLIGANAVTNAANAAVTNDTTTNAVVYPVWATASFGNLPMNVTSTKLSFNPSTGVLSATGFAGQLTGNASSANSATTANNVAGGVAGAVPYQSSAGVTNFSAAGSSGMPLLSGGAGTPTWGALSVAGGGTGATSLTSGGLLVGNGTGAVGTASAAQVVAAIGATSVANATNATNAAVLGGVAASGYARSGTNTDITSMTGLSNGGIPLAKVSGAAASGANSDITSWSGGPLAGLRNAIINGNFGVNQRAVSGTVTLAAGAYGHDRFKAGASGCTYTFATTANVTTLTISAGSLQQVIEGVNLQSGTYTLSWSGTAQGKIGAGSYAASGVTGTATGGTNLTVEFSTGTLSKVQLEFGSVATAFEGNRPIGIELALCRRYCFQAPTGSVSSYGWAGNTSNYMIQYVLPFPVTMRSAPTNPSATFNMTNGAGVIWGGATTNSAVWACLASTINYAGFSNSATFCLTAEL